MFQLLLAFHPLVDGLGRLYFESSHWHSQVMPYQRTKMDWGQLSFSSYLLSPLNDSFRATTTKGFAAPIADVLEATHWLHPFFKASVL